MAKYIEGLPFVSLAKESPIRDYDSEDSIYDSLHARETDECRDTSDTDSYVSDTKGVLEYDVASITASEVFYSNESSSGTDDFDVMAVAPAVSDTNTSDVTDLCFLADAEESNGSTDVKLRRANYWTCVKCKTRQNIPMYRYCERCYQIRKTQFPPRPKLRKNRSKMKKHLQQSRRMTAFAHLSDQKDCSKKLLGSPNWKKRKSYSHTHTHNYQYE